MVTSVIFKYAGGHAIGFDFDDAEVARLCASSLVQARGAKDLVLASPHEKEVFECLVGEDDVLSDDTRALVFRALHNDWETAL